jgi:hypothetical protein
MAVVALRPVQDGDLDALFEQMRDPQGVQMAAFTPQDPDDRTAFDAHMARVRSSPGITMRAVICDGRLAGSIASFPSGDQTEVTYWIDRALWGKASRPGPGAPAGTRAGPAVVRPCGQRQCRLIAGPSKMRLPACRD